MTQYADIPRLYSALAEWISCMIFIILLKKRWNKTTTILISAGTAIIMGILFVITADAPLYLWIPFMLLAIGIMYFYLLISLKITPVVAGYCCAKAFLIAEFMASLEWQLHSFFTTIMNKESFLWQAALLLIIYVLIFFVVIKFEKPIRQEAYLNQLSVKEMISAVAVAIFAFLFSNMSFVVSDSPFSGKIETDIFTIRTLVDLCGIVILYAYQSKICEYMVEKELASIQSMYIKQYDQYRYYQNSMEMVHIKYHDLKHQIEGLRAEKDSQKRKEWIDLLEKELDENSLADRTGNQVLDTILAAKIFQAHKNHIRITCVADGKLLKFMHVTDICTIFGNALDNAIESVVTLEEQEKRMIHLSVSKQKNFVFINVSNYYESQIQWEDGRIPITSKADKKNHGYGLKSIYKIVEKYDGTMSVIAKNNWFELRVLIPDRNV